MRIDDRFSPRLTLSIGLAQPGDAGSLEAIIGAADNALYIAKRNGRNRVVASGPRMA